jgi:ABC-type glycerol-3-phosphate transport system permease component
MAAMSRDKRINRSRAGDLSVFFFLSLFSLFMLFPFAYAILQSFKPLEELFLYPPRFFIQSPTTENYRLLSLLTNNLWIPFSRYALNSAIVTVVGTVLNLAVASIAAFPLAKYEFPGSRTFFLVVIAALLFSGPVTALPQYIIVAKLGLINTYAAVILPAIAGPLGLFLMKNFMSQISDSILESATIDGAGMFRTFASIAFPLVKPASLTLLIFSFQALWSSTGGSFIYDEKMKLLPTVLSQITTAGLARAGVGAAAAVLMMIPPFVTFVATQSRVLETMAYSGIKG